MLNNIKSGQNLNKATEISLQSLKLDISIANHLSTLTVDQDFLNNGSTPIECEYYFPVEKNSVVTALNILLPDGTVLTSQIEEQQKALESYQDALSQGNAAAIGKSEDSDSMVVHVGNILPSQSVKIQIILISPISTDSKSWKFSVPSEFLPILTGDSGQTYPIEARIQIASLGDISDINSTWDFAWSLSDDKSSATGQINLALTPENSLSVTYKSSNMHTPTCIAQHKGEKFAAMISFIPLNTDGHNPDYLEGTGEFIFILDRSGSMNGNRMQLAKNAAVLFLKSLPVTSKFNIISFGTNAAKMFENSEITSTENINKAISLLEMMDATMGGTNIYNALSLIFEIDADHQYPRNLFLITDGGETNSQDSLALIKEKKSACRIHGFGIQCSGKEAKFLSVAAKLGKGSAFFVNDIQELGKSVISALTKCVLPCMNKWNISWTGTAVPTDRNIGCVYYGEMFTQYVLMDVLPDSLPGITYFDTYSKSDIEVSIQRTDILEGDQVFKLWAKNQITELSQDRTKNSRDIIEISKEYQVVSPLTAFACVKPQEGEVRDDLKTIKIYPRLLFSDFTPMVESAMPIIWPSQGFWSQERAFSSNTNKFHLRELYCMRRNSPKNEKAVITPQVASNIPILNSSLSNFGRLDKGSPSPERSYYSSSNPGPSPKDNIPDMNRKIKKENFEMQLKSEDLFQGSKKLELSNMCESEIGKIAPELRTNPLPSTSILASSSNEYRTSPVEKLIRNDTDKMCSKERNTYFEIITKIKSEGYWDYNEVIALFEELERFRKEIVGIENNALATAFILCYLSAKYSEKVDEWILMKRKAINWLMKAGIDFEICKTLFTIS